MYLWIQQQRPRLQQGLAYSCLGCLKVPGTWPTLRHSFLQAQQQYQVLTDM